MQALSPSTSIRPLGEEHLRMFRRMTSEREIIPRIALPEEAKAKVLLSNSVVTYKEAESTARKLGGRLATLIEFCMEERLIKTNRGLRFFIDWKDVPNEEGWYRADRKRIALTKITGDKSESLEWHERLYFYQSVLDAIKEKRPLVAYVDYYGGDEGWVVVGSGVGGGGRDRVAYVKDDKK